MEIKNKYAHILTPDGEFVKVKIKGSVPSIGSTYSGQPSSKLPLSKYASIAACFILFFSFSGAAYAYYTPVASLVLKSNPSIELKINRWNKIIKTLPLNDTGKNILNSVNIKNKSVNEGLNIILNEADKENFFKNEPDKKISLDVNSDRNLDLNINELENKLKEKNFELEVNYPETPKSNNTKDNTIKAEKNNTKDNDTKTEKNNSTDNTIKSPKNTDNQNNMNSKNKQNEDKYNNKNSNNYEKSNSKEDTKSSIKTIEEKPPTNKKDKKKIIKPKDKKSSVIIKNIDNKLKTNNKKTKKEFSSNSSLNKRRKNLIVNRIFKIDLIDYE